MLEGGLQPNTTALNLLSVVSKIFEKLVNQLVDHLKISGLWRQVFSIYCRSSDSCI